MAKSKVYPGWICLMMVILLWTGCGMINIIDDLLLFDHSKFPNDEFALEGQVL